jgi:cytochrome c oxidase subunit 2
MIETTSTMRRVTTCLSALSVGLCLSSCGGIQNAINPAGPNAENLSRLWWLMFTVCSIVFVLVMIAVLLSLRKATAEAADRTSLLEPSEESERRRRNIIISATSITVIVLFVFLIASYSSGRSLRLNDPTKNGLSIDLTGHQWWWEVRYNDVDAGNIFTTANEIHIPVGVPVMFTLHGGDVIHSFWVPNLAGKKDLIPGKLSTMWLQADKPGVYRGQCAEYCGLQHAKMALWVVAEPQEQFNAWRQNQTQEAVAASSEAQKRGQQVFFSTTCVMCHAISGTAAGSNIGPNLTHVGSRHMLGAATLENTRDHLAQWIKNSQTFKPGNRMPQHDLSDADLQALVEYVQSLK